MQQYPGTGADDEICNFSSSWPSSFFVVVVVVSSPRSSISHRYMRCNIKVVAGACGRNAGKNHEFLVTLVVPVAWCPNIPEFLHRAQPTAANMSI